MTRTAEDEDRLLQALVSGLQADLNRTLAPAPEITTIRSGRVASKLIAIASPATGRAFTANGGVDLDRDAPALLVRLAVELADALAAGTFGTRIPWPTCPTHGSQLAPRRDDGDMVFWVCRHDGVHNVALVGALGLPEPQ